jgi:hypothetical protein
MNSLWGFGGAPTGFPWPESAFAVAFGFASGGISSDPRTPHPTRHRATAASTALSLTHWTMLALISRSKF